MAGSVNKVILIGNLGKDPEVRTLQNGGKVANLSLATSESWKDKSTGERKEKTEWHRVVIFGNLADIAERYLKKGSKVYVSGSLQTRKWTDKDGQDKYSTEVVLQGFGGELTMLDGKGGGGGSGGMSDDAGGGGWDSGDSGPPRASSGGGKKSGPRDEMDDDIPLGGSFLMPKAKRPASNCDKDALAAFDYSRLSPVFGRLSKPAQRALINNKILTPAALAKWDLADVSRLHGIGPSAIPLLKTALRKQ